MDETHPQPLCPHCEKELEYLDDHKSSMKWVYCLDVLSCPHCRKVLGTVTRIR